MYYIKYQWLRRSQRLISLLMLVGGLTTTTVAVATNQDEHNAQSNPINLSQTLSRVLRDSPVLSVYPYDLRAAEARRIQAGLRPNPELSLELENIAGDNEFKGTESAEITLALSQVIELGGKRKHRRGVGRLDKALLQQDYELARLDVLAKAANQFLELAQTQYKLQLIQRAADWASEAEAAVQRRHKAGSASRSELSQARIEHWRAKLAVSDMLSALEVRKQQLAALWNAEQVNFSSVQADLFELVNVPTFSQLRIKLNQAPLQQRFLTLDRLRQAELELALSQRRQNVSIGLGVKHFEATGDQALSLQLSMPIGISNRNQGGIEEARIALERLSQEQSSSRIQLYAELHRLYQRMQQARQAVQVLQRQALPEAEQALIQTKQGYRKGRFTYLELVEARRLRLSVELDAINVAAEFHRTLILLEKLTGESLTQAKHSIIKTGLSNNPIQDSLK